MAARSLHWFMYVSLQCHWNRGVISQNRIAPLLVLLYHTEYFFSNYETESRRSQRDFLCCMTPQKNLTPEIRVKMLNEYGRSTLSRASWFEMKFYFWILKISVQNVTCGILLYRFLSKAQCRTRWPSWRWKAAWYALQTTGLGYYRPFGGGMTLCSGRTLGRREVLSFAALILWRYEIQLVQVGQEVLGTKGMLLPRLDEGKPSLGIAKQMQGDDSIVKITKRI